MALIANILVALVAIQHFAILIVEMFFWTRPAGLKTFRMKPAQAEATKVLAGNQGLYNGFLAAGLGWALFHPLDATGFQLKLFFLGCVVVAGLYGGATVSRRIVYIQAIPALLAIICVLVAG